jgi:hypothetical protein
MTRVSARNWVISKYRRIFYDASNWAGGKWNLVARARKFLAIALAACSVSLLLSLSGCASSAPTLDEDIRASLGTVGILSVGPQPDGIVTGPIGTGREAGRGALRGGGIGGLTGAGAGAIAGLATGPCAPVAVPIFAAIGAGGGLVIGAGAGALYHAVTAIPQEQADEIASVLNDALAARAPQTEFRRQLLMRMRDRAPREVVDLEQGNAEIIPLEPDYGVYAEQGVTTVFEITVAQISFAAEEGDDPELSLVVLTNVRLIRLPENEILWSQGEVAFVSEPRPSSIWNSEPETIGAELEAGFDAIATQISEVMYPDEDE